MDDEIPDEGYLDEEDIEEIIELDDGEPGENLADEVGDMDLEHFDPEDGGATSSKFKPSRDDAKIVFAKHQGAVFCIDVDPQGGSLAVSGGEDDMAYVWKVESGEIILTCTGHKDSVTQACFSHDCVYVATGDMGGLVKVWKLESKEAVWDFECSDLEWLHWHFAAPVLLAGTVDGNMWMWKIPHGDCKTFQGPGCATNSAALMPDGKRAVAGYEDGTIRVWNLKEGSVLHSIIGSDAHKESVTSLQCHHENTLAMSGSVDVTAKVINTNTGKVTCTFNCESTGSEEEDSVETVGFCNVQNVAATGTLSGMLTIWDLPKQMPRQKCKHDAGVVKLQWSPSSPTVYTCSLNGIVQLWDSRNGQSVAQWTGHEAEILDFVVTKDGNTLITSSGDHTARVFSLHSPDR